MFGGVLEPQVLIIKKKKCIVTFVIVLNDDKEQKRVQISIRMIRLFPACLRSSEEKPMLFWKYSNYNYGKQAGYTNTI